MLDFLMSQNSSEAPGFLSILLAVLSSFFLSSLIVITYEVTTRDPVRPENFLQSLALISIVAATVMQAIGDSLARGLGMLGALAIIRFRTRLNNPRNMTFMFASLAVGISCGVFGFTIAFVGTIIFCLAAIALRFTRFLRDSRLHASLRVTSSYRVAEAIPLEALFSKYCSNWSADQYRINTTRSDPEDSGPGTAPARAREVNYQLVFKDQKDAAALVEELNRIDGLEDIRLRFNSNTEEF